VQHTVQGPVVATWGVTADGACWHEWQLPEGLPATFCLPGQPPVQRVGGTHRFQRGA